MKQSNLRTLLLASFSGRLVYAIASLVSLPILAKLLGAESVGLIGFFTTLVMVMMVFEGGLTSNLIQQLARRKVKESYAFGRYAKSAASLTLTYLIFFAIVGGGVAFLVACSSDVIMQKWLNFTSLSTTQVGVSIKFMGLFIAMNLPIMILQGVFVGRELQLKLNMLYMPYSLARTIGVLLVLSFYPSACNVQSYFLLQIIVQAMYLFMLLFMVFKEFSAVLAGVGVKLLYLKKGFSFSRGVLLISLTSIFVVQYDKVYLSGHISLADYAAYTLASTLAGIPYIFSSALSSVLFPRFSMNLASSDYTKIVGVFRAASCAIALLMTVLSVAVCFFSEIPLNILFERELSSNIQLFLPVLLVGTALQSLLIVPFALQMAAKWTSLALRLNLIWVPIIFFSLPLLVSRFGAIGGAYGWLIYNIFSCVLTFFFVGKRFDFLNKVAVEVMKLVVITIVVSVSIFYSVVRVMPRFLNDYFVLALELGSILIVVVAGLYVFRKSFIQFR